MGRKSVKELVQMLHDDYSEDHSFVFLMIPDEAMEGGRISEHEHAGCVVGGDEFLHRAVVIVASKVHERTQARLKEKFDKGDASDAADAFIEKLRKTLGI